MVFICKITCAHTSLHRCLLGEASACRPLRSSRRSSRCRSGGRARTRASCRKPQKSRSCCRWCSRRHRNGNRCLVRSTPRCPSPRKRAESRPEWSRTSFGQLALGFQGGRDAQTGRHGFGVVIKGFLEYRFGFVRLSGLRPRPIAVPRAARPPPPPRAARRASPRPCSAAARAPRASATRAGTWDPS